ncbi:MAG: MFS transporter [Candidatus Dormibacteraeota bacterium]|nr:MFS transporter [Candidatus Dormibacteraeota bacterium]
MQTESMQKVSRGLTTWLSFLLLSLFNFLLTSLGASSERLRSELGLSRTQVGLHATVFAVGVIAAGLTANRMSRRFGRRAVVAAGAGGMAAGALLLAAGRTPAMTLGGAFAMGAAGSLMQVLLLALLADLHGRRSGAILAEANALSSLFAALAPSVIGVAVALGVGWRGALALGAAALIVTAAAFWRATPETVGRPLVAVAAEAPEERRLPSRYWRWWAAVVLAVCVEFSFVFWTADELRAAAAAAPALAAGAVAVFELALAAGRLLGARILSRLGNLPVLRLGMIIAAAGFAVFWSARSVWPALAGLALAGLGVSMLYPVSLARAIAAAGGRSDLGSARATLASGLAIGLAPFAFGVLADAGGVHAAYLVVPVLLLGVWLASTLAARLDPARADSTHGRRVA